MITSSHSMYAFFKMYLGRKRSKLSSLGVGIQTNFAGISISAAMNAPEAFRSWNGSPYSGTALPPALGLNSFLFRTDRMPYSLAFWHLKILYEDEEGITIQVYTTGGKEEHPARPHGEDGYTLHVHTSGDWKGHTMHSYRAGSGKGMQPVHPHCMQQKQIILTSTLLVVEKKTPLCSHCWL